MRWWTLKLLATTAVWCNLHASLSGRGPDWHDSRVLFSEPRWAFFLWSLPRAVLWSSLPLFKFYATLLSITVCFTEKPKLGFSHLPPWVATVISAPAPCEVNSSSRHLLHHLDVFTILDVSNKWNHTINVCGLLMWPNTSIVNTSAVLCLPLVLSHPLALTFSATRKLHAK